MDHSILGEQGSMKKLLLVGNPNVGKSVLFSSLTGRYVTVSNYPGTTVEVSRGNARLLGRLWQVIDTPGVNNLLPHSEDERVTRDLLMEEGGHKVIQVADAKNLRRALLITLELAEMGLNQILVLNMEDEARDLGIQIDVHKLSEVLGIPVVTTVATRKKGLDRVIQSLEKMRVGSCTTSFAPEIEQAVADLEPLLPEAPISRRSLALMLLCGDETLSAWLNARVTERDVARIEQICRALQTKYEEPVAYVVNRQRLLKADQIVDQVMRKGIQEFPRRFQRIGDFSMHPIWGLPILLTVLFLIYLVVGRFGAGFLVDLIENEFFGQVLVPWTQKAAQLIPIAFLRDLLVGQYGLVTMALTYALAIVLPIVGTFFFAFGVLEDSGYMPRLAVLVNKAFKLVGLSGKAVLPLLLGLGCDTMATLTARILDTKRERILVTLLLALGVPCSAQLGVILGMLGGLSMGAVLIWAGVVMATMLLVGFLAARVLPGEEGAFVLEIPPMRVPQLRNVLVKTTARVEWYLKEAVPLFILATLILFILDRIGVLETLQSTFQPLVSSWLGLPQRTTEAFLIGFLRRDYGAAGLYSLSRQGELDPIQVLVSLVTITLFVPCVANLMMIFKERGWRTAVSIVLVVFPVAFGVGGLLNHVLRWTGWTP
ncbi:MAG: ferrous iron transport protein B [bacterium]